MMENDSNQPAAEAGGASAAGVAPANALPGRSSRLAPWLSWAFLALALLVVVGVRVRLLDFPLERDEGEYAYMGQLIQEGIPPYQLAYNMKMPGTYLAYAGITSVFGQTAWGIHLGLLLVHLATLVVLFLLARRLLDLPGAAIATATYALMILSPAYFGLSAHATHFVMLPTLLGFWMLFRVEKEGRPWGCLLAGGLFGVAFLMKQQGMFFGIFGGLWLGWMALARKASWGQVLARLGFYSLGCVLPFLVVCLWLKIAGVFPNFWFWTFSYAREYVNIEPLKAGLLLGFKELKYKWAVAPVLWVMAGMGLVGLVLPRQSWNMRFFLGGFLLFSVLSVCPGLYFRPHYFILMVPALALLVGLVVSQGGRWLGAKFSRKGWESLPFVLAVLACAQSLYADRSVLFFLPPVEAGRAVYNIAPFPESTEIARYIEEHTSPGDHIQVMGSEPQIYFFAHRHASSGYIYTYPLMEPQTFAYKMQDEMIAEIERNPPAFMVLVSVPSSWGVGPKSDPRLLAWMSGYLDQNMRQVGLLQLADTMKAAVPVWGTNAATVPLNSDFYVAVYQRVAGGKGSDRTEAIARNKYLLDHFSDGRVSLLIANYRYLLSQSPNDARLHFVMAGLYTAEHETDEAIKECQTALQLDPQLDDAHKNLGKLLGDKGLIKPAIEQFREAIRADPKDAEAHFDLANLYVMKHEPDPAIAELQTSARLDPKVGNTHDDLGQLLASRGLMVPATRQFREALRLNPEDATAHFNLGGALNLQGQTNAALGEFETAARLNPEDVNARIQAGDLLVRLGRKDEAIHQYQAAAKLTPQDAAVHGQIGNLLAGEGQNAAAMEEFQAALRLKPDDAMLRDNLGNLLARAGRNDEAITQFQEALRLKPENAKAHDNLGIVLVKQGRMVEASSQFAEAVRLSPNFVKAHDNWGFVLASQGRTAEAVAQYQEALRLNPADMGAQTNLAKALASENKSSGGQADLPKP